MRTPEQIIEKFKAVAEDDMFGVMQCDLMSMLDYEHAKQFLKPEITAEEWNKDRPVYTVELAREKIRAYLDFAWDKARSERGLSASRSQDHFSVWMWLACDDEVLARVEAAPYDSYGIPKLEIIEAHYRPKAVAA